MICYYYQGYINREITSAYNNVNTSINFPMLAFYFCHVKLDSVDFQLGWEKQKLIKVGIRT